MPALFRALRHRNYRLFISGQLISLIGTWMQTVGESWLVYRLTGSAVLLGTVGFANRIPVLLLSTVGGAVADRYDRHKIVIATQAASMCLAGLLAFLTLSGRVQVWHLMAIATGLGVVNAFDIPARQSFVVQLVSRVDLPNAIAINSTVFNGARVVGPAIAGVLVAAVGEGWCFFANAVSYVAVIAGLLLIRVSPARLAAPRVSALAHLAEGFRFAWGSQSIRTLLLLLGLVSWSGRCGRLDRCAESGSADHAQGLRPNRGHSGYCSRGRLGCLLSGAPAVARRPAAGAGWLFHDDTDGRHQHSDPVHGTGCPARQSDGALLDDVHGDGARGCASRRHAGRAPGGSPDGCSWRRGLHCGWALSLLAAPRHPG